MQGPEWRNTCIGPVDRVDRLSLGIGLGDRIELPIIHTKSMAPVLLVNHDDRARPRAGRWLNDVGFLHAPELSGNLFPHNPAWCTPSGRCIACLDCEFNEVCLSSLAHGLPGQTWNGDLRES